MVLILGHTFGVLTSSLQRKMCNSLVQDRFILFFLGSENPVVRIREFFFWLLLKDRLSTRELLKRKRMVLDDYNCVLSNSTLEESLIHLFLACPFSSSCWATLGLVIQQPADPLGTLVSFKNQLQLPFFMKIIVTMCWAIWTIRNDVIFRLLVDLHQ